MLCAYPTVKYVVIQDARLVLLRYLLLLVIIIYVVVFELWSFGGWLDPAPVVGVVRFSLQHPTKDNCDPSFSSCFNDFVPLNELPYCQQFYSNKTSPQANKEYPGHVYPCEIYEAINAQIINEKSITVITRASSVEQNLVCTSDNMTCPRTYQSTEPNYKFYTAQTEAFTVLLDHAVASSKICTRNSKQSYACSSEATSYHGRLYSQNKDLCERESRRGGNAFVDYRGTDKTTNAPCYVGPNQTSAHQDFFSLDVLLQAAGVDLDDCNHIAGLENHADNNTDESCETYRDTGATLILNIYWNDFVPYVGRVEPYYYYSPQLVGRSNFKQYVPFYNNHYRQSRTLLNAHGIRIAVLLGGEFNHFNIVTFLVTLTTALGLLAVATTIVDGLMLYILPEKDRYQEAKYENSEEFDGTINSAVAGLTQLIPGVPTNRPISDDAAGVDASSGGDNEQTDGQQVSTEEDGLSQPLLLATNSETIDRTE